MHREESEGTETCSVCGAELLSGGDPSYTFGVQGVICWNCSLERGGRYDADLERWSDPPDISGLPDEEYGSTPGERRRT